MISVKSFLFGMVIASLSWYFVLVKVVSFNAQVISIQNQSFKAIASTCVAWYEISKPRSQKKKSKPPTIAVGL